MPAVIEDAVKALAGVGLVLALISPIAYALWRARHATEVARVPAGALKLSLAIGVGISMGIFAATSLAAGASVRDVASTLFFIVGASCLWLCALLLGWRLARRRHQR